MKEIFSTTGSYHLIAISGLHFGIVFSLFSMVLKKVPYNIRLWILAGIMTLYLILTDFYVSAVRAYIMAVLYIFGKLMKKPSYALNVWAVAGAVMVFLYPAYIRRAGFWLSMTATLFIMLSLGIVRKLSTYPAKAFAVTTAAQAGVLPLLFHYFGQYNLLSPLLNIFALLFIFPLVSLGLIMLFPMPAFMAEGVVWVSEEIITAFKFYLELFNDSMYLIEWKPGWQWVAVWYMVMLIALQMRSIYRRYAWWRGKGA